jgi:hypothetical protein
MKNIHPLSVQPSKIARRKLRRDSSQQLIHGLLNQLSVINLCSFKMRGRRGAPEVGVYERELNTIERAVNEASELAEALKTLWDKPELETRPRHVSGQKQFHASNTPLKIVPAREVAGGQIGD